MKGGRASASTEMWLLSGLLADLRPPAGRDRRLLGAAVLTTTSGNGLYLACATLYLVREVGLSPSQVGAGFTIAGLLGLIAGVPLGRLADARGPRQVYLATLAAETVSMASFALVRTFEAFLTVAFLIALAEQGSRAARGALVAQVGGAERVQYRAYLRVLANLGVTAGALAAGVAIAADTATAYRGLLLANSATFAAAAVVVFHLPRVPPVTRPPGVTSVAALRDRPYLAITVLYGLISVHYTVLTIALPLWVIVHTSAPQWIVSPLLAVNTIIIVFFQIRASRGVRDVASGARMARRAGVVLAAAWGLVALTGSVGTRAAVAVLVLAVAVHTVGEMWAAAGEFELSFGLADEHAHGDYQGTFHLGTGVFIALSPLLLTMLCINWGWPGWLVLGGVLAGVGVLIVPTARWASRSRPPAPPG